MCSKQKHNKNVMKRNQTTDDFMRQTEIICINEEESENTRTHAAVEVRQRWSTKERRNRGRARDVFT